MKLKEIEKLTKDNYEEEVTRLISHAHVLDHSLPPCEDRFVPDTIGKTYVMYIQMYNEQDYETWSVLAKVSLAVLFDFFSFSCCTLLREHSEFQPFHRLTSPDASILRIR